MYTRIVSQQLVEILPIPLMTKRVSDLKDNNNLWNSPHAWVVAAT